MYLVTQPSSCSQRLRAGTSLWRDVVPGTEEGVISLPGQRTHDAAGPPIPPSLTAFSGWEVGVASTHLDLWASQIQSWRRLRVTCQSLGLGQATPARI